MGTISSDKTDTSGCYMPVTAPPPSECPTRTFPRLASLIEYLLSVRSRASLGVLEGHLRGLTVCRDDLAPACAFGTRGYKRNTIARSEYFELLALCWRSGDATPIHDHKGSSCAFRVVEGTGTEIRFRTTDCGLVCPTEVHAMPPGYVCAAEDNDIHQVANLQAAGADLITLHIYSPPIRNMCTYQGPLARVNDPGPTCCAT
ncbi:MAG: cysteine dioxygenase family protein [Phycisphaerae bacterium]|nr:cysteine dioxygenase family protein [Phycisphaerae bacterium]